MTKAGSKSTAQAPVEYLAVRMATVEKGNGGNLGYEVGKHVATGKPALRVVSNSSSGTFSREWVTLAAIRAALAGAHERFPASTLASAIVAKGKNNAFFVSAVLVGEGLLARHAEGGLTFAGDWKAWEDTARNTPITELPSPDSKAPSVVDGEGPHPPPDSGAGEKKVRKAGKKPKESSPSSPEPDADGAVAPA